MKLVQAENKRWSLQHGSEWLEDPVDPMAAAAEFVTRSQVDGARLVVLFGLGLGYRVRRLRQLVEPSRVIVVEPDIATLGPMLEREELAEHRGWLGDLEVHESADTVLAQVSDTTTPGERIVLCVPAAYRRSFPEQLNALALALMESEALKQIRENTIVQRFPTITRNTLRNLARLSPMVAWDAYGSWLDGVPAFIVGAGPSLDRNRHLLAECAKRGAIFAVPTVARLVEEVAGRVDVLPVLEAMDMSEAIVGVDATVKAIDCSVSPETLEAVRGPATCVYFQRNDPAPWIAHELGSKALLFGASVATTAYALAKMWGASPIVLIGQDLAYTDDRVYCTGLGERSERKMIRKGPLLFVEHTAEYKAQLAKDNPDVPLNEHRPGFDVPAWGGGDGEVVTSHELALFRRWFMHNSDPAVAINATEGGARIEGMPEMRLAAVLDALPERVPPVPPPAAGITQDQTAAIRDQLRAAAERGIEVLGAAVETMSPDACAAVLEFRRAHASKAIEVMAGGEIVKIKRRYEGESSAAATQEVFAAMLDAARELKEMMG